MTAQIGNFLKLGETRYSILALSNPINFDPRDLGFTPSPTTSACWAGYWCEYRISTDDKLILQNLYINSKDDIYPEINGIKAKYFEEDDIKTMIQYMGGHLYENIDIPILYNGRVVIGNGFLDEYYVHMGYQNPKGYEEVIEIVFEEGVYLYDIDHSETVKKLREENNNKSTRRINYENSSKFIKESFSLDFKDKCWWLL